MGSDTTPITRTPGPPAPPDPDSCDGVVELVTEYLDGALDADVRARFEAHLAACDGCDIYLDQMRTTIAAAGRVGLQNVPPATLDGLIAAFRAARGA
jgi:anti-sigma factor RsiW